MKKLKKIKEMLAQVLISVELNSLTTDKGVVYWESDEDLKVGDALMVEDENGEKVAAADGDYMTDTQTTIKVVEGKVSEITEKEEEVEEEIADNETEDVAEEVVAEEVENPTNEGEESDTEAIVKLREEVNELYAIVDTLRKEVEELRKRPEARPAHEEFEAITKPDADRTTRILGYRKK